MGGFDHAVRVDAETESERSAARRRRYGLALFFAYLLFYGGFVLLNAFAPGVMAKMPALGINLALLYGLALIAVAFLMALIYDRLCRRIMDADREGKGGP